MTAPQTTTVGQATTIRLIHASLVAGVVLFAIVVYFVVRPTFQGADLDATIARVMLGAAVAIMALGAGVMRRQVPVKSTDESANLFWTRAMVPALITWATLEGAGLLSVVVYMLTGMVAAIATAALAVVVMAALAPARLERA